MYLCFLRVTVKSTFLLGVGVLRLPESGLPADGGLFPALVGLVSHTALNPTAQLSPKQWDKK